MQRHRLRAVLALAAVGAVALGMTSAAAGEGDQVPLTQGESVTLWAGSAGVPLDLLANASDPEGEKLKICRFGEAQPDWRLDVEPVDGRRDGHVELNLDPATTGTYSYEYRVCDHSYLVPATLTVDVKPVGVTTVDKVPERPRKVRVTNPDQHRIFFMWWPRHGDGFGAVRVPAGGSKLVRAGAARIDWMAAFKDGDKAVCTGYGTVGGLTSSANPTMLRPAGARLPSALAGKVGDRLPAGGARIDVRRADDLVDPTTVLPPATQPDELHWWAGAMGRVRVLANDSDPQGQHLDVCRVDPSGRAVSAWTQLSNTGFTVEAGDKEGTYTVTYYACNDARLSPGTVTVHLRRAKPVQVTADGGTLRIANPNGERVRVGLSDLESEARRTVRVEAHSVRRVHVSWHLLSWYGSIGHPRGYAGYGHLRLHR